MAVQFSASGQDYLATLNAGTQTVYTFCAWVNITTDRNTWSGALSLYNTNSSDGTFLETNEAGTQWECMFDNANDQVLVVATVGSWYFLAVTVNGSAVNTYVKPLGGSISNSTSTTISSSAASVVATRLRIGDWPEGGEWLNGRITGVKVWLGAALTQAELNTESTQLLPVRTANLKCAYPLETAETTDYSGNGFTLAAAGSPTTEAGPSGIPLGTLGGGSGGAGGTATVRSRATGAQNTATTSHSITLPAGVVAGDLLVVEFSNDESTDPTTISTTSPGWSVLGSVEQGTTTNHRGSVLWKRATGSDALTVTTAFAQESTHVSHCVQNGADPVLASSSGGSATSADVAAVNGLTLGDYLSIVYCATDASTTTSQSISTPPSGYTTTASQNPSTTSSAATFAMERSFDDVTAIPSGTITLGAAEQWVTFNVAIRGVASGPEPGRMLLSHR
jgi:hypothetical protein